MMNKKRLELNKSEIKAILFWLKVPANRQWKGGSYMDIEGIYFKLNEFVDFQVQPKYWHWKVDK